MQSNHPRYVDDCRRLYDFIFPHDDSVNDRAEGGQLDLAWQTTNVIPQLISEAAVLDVFKVLQAARPALTCRRQHFEAQH